MDNIMEKIYGYVYIAGYPINATAIIVYLIGKGSNVSVWFPIIVFGVTTLIMFVMGRLIQERFDNSLQLYLIVISLMYVVATFIGPYSWGYTTIKGVLAVLIFAAAFFLDDFFEAE